MRTYRDRDAAIRKAYDSGGYGLKAIGEHFGLHYSRVSRIVAAGGKAKGKTSVCCLTPVCCQSAQSAVCARRTALYAQARAKHPARWSRGIRDWSLPAEVWLNRPAEENVLREAA